MLFFRGARLVIDSKKNLMTYGDWCAKFVPRVNEATGTALFKDGDEVLEKYKKDLPRQVWTFFEDGDDGYIIPGMPDDVHQLNYYLTEVPFEPAMALSVSFNDMADDSKAIQSQIDKLEWLNGLAAGEGNAQEIKDCLATIQDKAVLFHHNWHVPFVPLQTLQNPTPTTQLQPIDF